MTDDVVETTHGLRDTPPGPKGRWFRRLGTFALALIMVLAALDLLGPSTGTVTAEAAGYRLTVEHASITRAGQPSPLHLTITSETGFGESVAVRLCDEHFNDMDFQNWYPSPAAETTVPPWILYEFDPPPSGDTIEISLDARTAPGQFGETDDCEVSVMHGNTPIVSTSFTVWRLP